jgi:hypothetical protein
MIGVLATTGRNSCQTILTAGPPPLGEIPSHAVSVKRTGGRQAGLRTMLATLLSNLLNISADTLLAIAALSSFTEASSFSTMVLRPNADWSAM